MTATPKTLGERVMALPPKQRAMMLALLAAFAAKKQPSAEGGRQLDSALEKARQAD